MVRCGEGHHFPADKEIFILSIERNLPFKVRFQLLIAWMIGNKAEQKALRAKYESGRVLPKLETVLLI